MTEAARSKKSAYYDAPTIIEDTPGVVVQTFPHGCVDCYIGTAEALVAAGLAQPEMFPGQPGRGVGSATYRPSGVQPAEGRYWWNTPGFMRIFRKVTGDFKIELVVSHEEQAKRALARQARNDAHKQEMELERIKRTLQAREPEWPFRYVTHASWNSLTIEQQGLVEGHALLQLVRYKAEQQPEQRASTSHLRVVWSAPAQ